MANLVLLLLLGNRGRGLRLVFVEQNLALRPRWIVTAFRNAA